MAKTDAKDLDAALVKSANKKARVLWAQLAHNEDYRAPTAA